MLSRLRIGPRLALAMGVTLSIFLLTLGLLGVTLGTHVASAEQVAQENLPLMASAEHMVLDVAQVQQFLTDVSATRSREAYADAEAHARHFRTGIKGFRAHYLRVNDAGKLQKIEHLGQRFEHLYALGKEMAEVYVTQGTAAGNRIMRRFDQDSLDLQAEVDRFETQNHERMIVATNHVVSSGHAMQWLLLISGVVSLVVSVIIGALTMRSITLPVAHAVEIAESVAAGNLALPIHRRGNDELALLLDSMARMQANLRQLLANAKLDADAVASSNAWQSALQGLRQTAAELEDLYQNAPCGYHSLDAQGRFARINDTELGWLGYAREAMLGQPMANFLAPDGREAHARHFARLLRTGGQNDVELEFLCQDGSTLPVLISASAVVDDQGELVMTRASVFDLTGHKHLEDERANQARHIEAMSRRLISVQEKERHRLSSELHDRTGANLATLNTYLKIISNRLPQPLPADLIGFFNDSRAVLEDTTRSVREICADLRPSMLDYAGLLPAVESYAKQFEKRNGVAVCIQARGPEMRLPHEIESNLFRIVQEVLTNCAKHAQASLVTIKLDSDETMIRLAISDDGVGFDPDALLDGGKEPGLGLITMRERCEFIGGHFSLRSEPGKGTRVDVVLAAPSDAAPATPSATPSRA